MSETADRKEKFTPGPWVVKRDDWGMSVICKDSVSGLPFAETPICDISQEEDTGGIQDAALIAAAPDMYAALEKAVKDYGKPGGPWNVPSEPGTWIHSATSALAKARGES